MTKLPDAHPDAACAVHLAHAVARCAHDLAYDSGLYEEWVGPGDLVRVLDRAVSGMTALVEDLEMPGDPPTPDAVRHALDLLDLYHGYEYEPAELGLLRETLQVAYWAAVDPESGEDGFWPDVVSMLSDALRSSEALHLDPWKWCGHNLESWHILRTLLADGQPIKQADNSARLLTQGENK